ncbi:MAG: 2-isopropylmalate synthase [Coriobacteriales bacterium]|jgi:2-isopropylmalate synthase|nr:2-isopropylmalate synthase [Coriobacteriales bacterium]
MTRNILIYDTTLRDGEQAPGCSMNLDEKLSVARQLELLGVDVIEAGFAISSPGDFESVQRIAATIKDCSVSSLARSLPKDIDVAWEAVQKAVNPRIHLFLATSKVHMQYKLRMSEADVVSTASRMVAHAKRYCSNVQFSCEDATRSEREFLALVLGEAIKAGATTVNIPDTVGYATPEEMSDLIIWLREHVVGIDNVAISVHCHNDLGMAVANTLAGVRGGAAQVECTINGIGERAGNAALEEVAMALKTRADHFDASIALDTTKIYHTSKLVYSLIGQGVPLNKAIVGTNAFLHESGIHQHGVMAKRSTYEIMTPEQIGIFQNNMVLGKHSGRHAVEDRLKELGYRLSPDELNTCFEAFKVICDKKKSVSDSDLEAIVNTGSAAVLAVASGAPVALASGMSVNSETSKSYLLQNFDVHSGKESTAVSVICLRHAGKDFEEVSLGDGPVDAAYNAIAKIMGLKNVQLASYTIHSTSDGTDALGEVVVKLRCEENLVTGRGLSTDIIEASILAYINAGNRLILKND